MKQLDLFDKKGRPFDKHSAVLEQIKVFDNRGKTFDRYFVIIKKESFIMSHNPMDPQGVNQFAGTVWDQRGDALGILLDHIPPEIEPAIIERVKDMEN